MANGFLIGDKVKLVFQNRLGEVVGEPDLYLGPDEYPVTFDDEPDSVYYCLAEDLILVKDVA